MSEIKIKNTTKFVESKWFGIKLSQTSVVILFLLALFGIIEESMLPLSIISIIRYVLFGFRTLSYISTQIFFFITGVIILLISCYTFSICVKSKNDNNEIQEDNNISINGIRWFGFILSRTSATILMFLAIIGIIPTISSIYNQIISLIDVIKSFLIYGLDWYELLGIIFMFHLISILISELIIYSYSIIRFSQLKKIIER
ncbi:MAG: hypothetical protein ACFFA7_06255 [Promethearchaeota archaeon]